MLLSEFVFSIPEFEEMYEFAQVNNQIAEKLIHLRKNVLLKVFASETCQYCKIYVPNLLKINDLVGFEIDFVRWEDYTDDEQFDLMEKFKLTGLPTIIVVREDKELGRIAKEPINSLEESLLNIFEKN